MINMMKGTYNQPVKKVTERSITGNAYFSWDPHLHNTYPLKYLLVDTKPTDFGLSPQYLTHYWLVANRTPYLPRFPGS